jgi:NAD(P)H-dependent FMN reductase
VTSSRIAVVPGSIRTGSLNRRLARDLAARLSTRGADAEVVDLADYPMPIYHGDDEAASGPPASAVALHDRLAAVDGLVLVSPEYNGSLPALLKNAIDWVTRVDRAAFRPLLIGLAATSPGSRGATTVLASMRHIVDHMRLAVLPEHLSVPHGGEAFDDEAAVAMTRPDVAAAADEFVDAYLAALGEWVTSGREAAR